MECLVRVRGIETSHTTRQYGTALPRRQFAASQVGLRQQLGNHASRLDAGEALVESLVAVDKTLVVEAQQDRGVEVVDVLFDDVVREVVGLTVDRAALAAAAGPSTW
jgi:hypothetical protein